MSVKKWKPLLFIVPLSFVLGIAWSLYLKEKSAEQKAYQEKNYIKVLAPKGYLPNRVLEDFKTQHKLGIQVTVIESERDLLLEALNNNEFYDVMFVDSANSRFLVNTENLLKPTTVQIPNIEHISADFKDLSVSGRPHLIPYSWQVIGWFVDSSKMNDLPIPLSKVFRERSWKSKISLMPSYIELYNHMKKYQLFAEEWFDTEQIDKIHTAIGFIEKQKIDFTPSKDLETALGNKWLIQMSHTQAAEREKENGPYQFYLPLEKGSLRVISMVIDKRSRKMNGALKFVNHLLDEDSVHHFLKQRTAATTVDISAISDLPMQYYPSYMRRLPVSRLELSLPMFANHATWVDAVKDLNLIKEKK